MDNIDRKNIKKIISTLKTYDYYYWNSKPIVPDSVYDSEYLKLKNFKKKYPNDKLINQYFSTLPTNEKNTFKKYKHQSFIGSLDKIRTVPPLKSYLNKWTTNSKDLWNTDSFVIESKCDGLSCVLYFNAYKGHKFLALTRGGGYYGADITPEIKLLGHMDIRKIQKRVGNRRLIVRGELLISKQDFNAINHNHKYANERNAVSGIINSKKVIDTKKGHVFLDTYTLVNRDDYPQYPTELSQIKFLKSLGFFEDLDVHVFKNDPAGKRNVIKYCTGYTKQHRDKIPFDIDGLTIKPNNTRNFINKVGDFRSIHRLGYNHHGPVHSKAWKFPPKSAVGILKSVKWQPSANGRYSPVGILAKPVHLMGSTIKKASLGSLPDAWHRDLRIGDHVMVRRMNDVIPKFVKPIKQLRDGNEIKITVPKNAKLVGKYVYMNNKSDNMAITLQRWQKFVSKPCLNIQGLSIKTIQKLIENKLINPKVYASLWNLPNIMTKKNVGSKAKPKIETYPKVLDLKGFGKKQLTNLEAELNKAKTVPLSRILLGLPIPNVGHKILDVVCQYIKRFKPYYSNFAKWVNLSGKLQQIIPNKKGFGESSVDDVVNIFDVTVYRQLKKLHDIAHLKMHEPIKNTNNNSNIAGMHFVITGKLSKPRKYFKNLIKSNGAKLQDSVNSKTDYLICNQASSSSKYQKAQKLGKHIINEKQFSNLL